MIEDLRFVQRERPNMPAELRYYQVLQAYDGHKWFDVPLVSEVSDE